MSEEQDYFHQDVCLFCLAPAKTKYYGNHGRDEMNVCDCQGRKRWEDAKAALYQAEELVATRLNILNLKNSVRNHNATLNSLTRDIENAQAKVAQLETQATRYEGSSSEKQNGN